MNTMKRLFSFKSVYLPVDFFHYTNLSANAVKMKKLNVRWLDLIMYLKQMMTLTLKLKLLIIFPCLFMNFMIFHKILLKKRFINRLSIFHGLMMKSNILSRVGIKEKNCFVKKLCNKLCAKSEYNSDMIINNCPKFYDLTSNKRCIFFMSSSINL